MGKAVGKGSLIDLPVGSAEVVLSSKGVGRVPRDDDRQAAARGDRARPRRREVGAASGGDAGPLELRPRRLRGDEDGRAGCSPRRSRGGSFAPAAGLEQATVALTGTTGPPLVTVKGPGGVSVSSAADGAPRWRARARSSSTPRPGGAHDLPHAREAEGRPPTRSPRRPGSPAIKSARVAQGLPAVSLKAKVTGTGTQRTLSYTASALGGRTVELYERARGAFSRLGAVKGARGRSAFAPAPGRRRPPRARRADLDRRDPVGPARGRVVRRDEAGRARRSRARSGSSGGRRRSGSTWARGRGSRPATRSGCASTTAAGSCSFGRPPAATSASRVCGRAPRER